MRSINILLVLGLNLSLITPEAKPTEKPSEAQQSRLPNSESLPLREGLGITLLIQSQMVNI